MLIPTAGLLPPQDRLWYSTGETLNAGPHPPASPMFSLVLLSAMRLAGVLNLFQLHMLTFVSFCMDAASRVQGTGAAFKKSKIQEWPLYGVSDSVLGE